MSGLVGIADAVRIGNKVVEMADRVAKMEKAVPDVAARWVIEIDDVPFEIIVRKK